MKASPGFQRPMRQLLRELFPELARVYANTTYSNHSQWRKACRVCSPDVFDKFFLLAIPVGEISEVEMAAFVEGLGDAEATFETLQRALASGKARRLLERLEDFMDELAAEHVEPLVKVMFDAGDDLRFESRGVLDFSADMQVPRILYQSIQRLEREDERYELLLRSVKNGTALYTVVKEVSLSEPKSEDSVDQLISDHDRWADLRDAAVTRIRSANESGELWDLDRLVYVLFRWLNWTTEDEVRAAINAYIVEDEKLVAFVSRFVSESHSYSMGDKVSRVHRKLNKKALERLLDLDAATVRLKAIQPGATENAATAGELVAMIEAKPEGPWDE